MSFHSVKIKKKKDFIIISIYLNIKCKVCTLYKISMYFSFNNFYFLKTKYIFMDLIQ